MKHKKLPLISRHYKRMVRDGWGLRNIDIETPGRIVRRDIVTVSAKGGAVKLRENHYG